MASSSRPGKETRTVRVHSESLGFQWCEALAKRAFPPTYVEATRSLEKAKQPPRGICDILKLSIAGAGPAFLVLGLRVACAALGFGLLLSALSRLTHILYDTLLEQLRVSF